MKKQRILICLIMTMNVLSTFCQLPSPSAGTIRRLPDFPSVYVLPRNVDVWLPDGYSSERRYAVLYMQDGQMLFDSAVTWNHQEWGVDEIMGRLMKEKKIRDCIVVGIWNSGDSRRIEYVPQKPFEMMTPEEKQVVLAVKDESSGKPLLFEGPVSDRYLKFLVYELKPYIDSVFSVRKGMKDTFIAGSSMGGLISLYAICEYPGVFGGAACLSTHWTGIFRKENNPVPAALMKYLENNLPSPSNHKIYFDYGTKTLDALYEPYQLMADSVMKQKGYTSKNWITRKFEGEDHSEKAWRKRFCIPAEFLLGKKILID